MIRPRFLFVHGWAGTPAIWDGVCADLAARGVPADDMVRVDLNPLYTDLAAGLPRLGPDDGTEWDAGTAGRPLIGIGHSLGVPLLLLSGLPLAGLLALNGFARFTSAPDHAAGTHPRILAQMRRRLLADPSLVLADFQDRAGLDHSEFLPGAAPALAAGLDLLSNIDARAAFGVFASPVTALCGADDAIVPPDLSRLDFPDPVFIDGAAHALPRHRPALIAEQALALAARC